MNSLRVKRLQAEHDALGCQGGCRWLSIPREGGFLLQEFCGERLVVFKSRTPRAVGGDGHTVARGLCKLDAIPDDGIEVAAGEMPANLIDDRLHEGGAA